MNMILEKLELTEELRQEIKESFESSVDLKASEKALAIVEAKQPAYEAYIAEQLAEKDAEMAKFKADLTEKLDAYLDQVVESFVEDNKLTMESATKREQMEAVLEGFNSLLIATGVEVSMIAEAKVEATDGIVEGIEADLAETNKTVDSLMEQMKVLKAQNAELLKTGLIQEEMASLNVVQKEKFIKLAETLEFDAKNAVRFIAQLDAIKETIAGTQDVTEKVVTEKVVTEKVVTETLVDASISEKDVLDVTTNVALYKRSASHLY